MAIKVSIPLVLQSLTNNRSEVMIEGRTVEEALAGLESQFPGIKERLCDEAGKLRRFVNIYVNQEDIRFLEMEQTPLKEDDEISIVPAVAGG